jgi:hypothetical protein
VAAGAKIQMIDGVPHVLNGPEPLEGRQDLHLKELWRIGADDEDVLLGAIGGALSDDEGNVYLPDTQLSEVTVISPAGEVLRTLGGQGDGPGEVRRLGGIFFMPDGQLALIQGFPGRVVTVNLDGTPGRGFHFQDQEGSDANFGVLVAGLARGGSFILTGLSMRVDGPVNTQSYYMSLCDASGVEKHRFFSKEHPINYAEHIGDEMGLDFVWARWDLGPDGRLYAAPHRDRYQIQILDPDGTLVRVIEREYESYSRTGDEKELVRRYVEAIHRNHPVPPIECRVEDTEPDIAGLRAAPNGELWVTTSRGTRNLPEGIGLLIDVFEPEGRFVRQVAVHGEFDPDRDLLRFLGEDRFLVVIGAGEGYLNSMGVGSGEDGEAEEIPPIEVICYEIG